MKKITRITLLAGFALGQALGLQGADPVESDYYQIDQIPIPDGVVLETSGIEMLQRQARRLRPPRQRLRPHQTLR